MSIMPPQAVACLLSEPDGRPITAGVCRPDPCSHPGRMLIMSFDRPGQLIARCLVGPVRDVVLTISDALPRPARLQRVYFDDHDGRVCELEVAASVASRPVAAELRAGYPRNSAETAVSC